MSVQSAKDFLQKIETDQALKKQVEAATDHEARLKLIQAAGFDFSMEEFNNAVAELADATGQELTPDELESIAGGVGRTDWCWHQHHGCSVVHDIA